MNPSPSAEFLDISLVDPQKVVQYERLIDDKEDPNIKNIHQKIGLLSSEGNSYHKYLTFNTFTKESFPIPFTRDGWSTYEDTIKNRYHEEYDGPFDEYVRDQHKFDMKWISHHICDPTAKVFCPNNESLTDRHTNFKMHKTLDNYSIGFIVMIGQEDGKDVAYVYGRTKDVIPREYSIDDVIVFTTLINKYYPLEVFIGQSHKNEMTTFSGGYGDKWDGNSILLRIDKLKYVHIGVEVYEFDTSEEIIEYVSSVGNNCVPYPYAESMNWCYDMSDHLKSPIEYHKDRKHYGNVFNVKDAKYMGLDIVSIAKRDTDWVKYPLLCKEETNLVLFTESIEANMVENTCDNDKLQLVQHVNEIQQI